MRDYENTKLVNNFNVRAKRAKKILDNPSFNDKADTLYRLHRTYKNFHFKHLVNRDKEFFCRIFHTWSYYRWAIIELSRHGYEIYHPEDARPAFWVRLQK